MTITTGFVVANIYYNQPLLNDIAVTYHISTAKVGQVAMITQVGYGIGLLFIVPLGDMFERRKLMLIDFVFMVTSLLVAAWAPNILVLLIASLFVGITSVIPQLMIPMAAHLAKPRERGKKIGFIMSGLLIGILLSRTVSGFVGEHFGWRTMFYIAAGMMLLIWLLVYLQLPKVEADYTGKYATLMRSLVKLFKEEPALRLASFRGALCFASFSAFWTTIVFLLKQHFNLGSDVAGAFGLLGALGAVAAGLMGRLSDKTNAYKLSAFTIILIIVSFIVFMVWGYTLIGLAVGVILMDVGVQATHISNQAIIFALNPSARNRINTIYMVSYFIGGSLGTFLATIVWDKYQWNGVCTIGIALSSIVLVVHLLNHQKMKVHHQTVRS
ncbi:MFS transporter [Mucilaginibacter boryungensis]|uniref:MFS transporter n=2 Tax=Mucilaginibacter boryungensis TaxID=768480 RepID=A0ABR9XKN2_9SPHI|nr:MFS transporter [Mucilaginibacter boryungensis]